MTETAETAEATEVAASSVAAQVADFAHLQARPSLIFARPGARPGTVGKRIAETVATIRYADAPAVRLGQDLHAPLSQLDYPDGRGEPAADSLHTLLVAAGGYQRHEPHNTYNAHRGYPSAQCMFPTELFLCTEAGSWHYDAAQHQLRPVGRRPVGQPPSAPGQVSSLIIAARPGKLPEYYRELQWSLSLCEAGHLTELLLALATALGLAPRLRTDFDDQAALRRIGAEQFDGWLPAAVIELGSADLPLATVAADGSWQVADDPVLAIDRLGWQAGRTDPASTAGPVRWPSQPGTEIALPAVTRPPATWAQLLFERSSGRATGGFAAAPEPMPLQPLVAALEQLRSTAASSWGGPTGTASGQGILVIAEQVVGLPDGLYEWSLADAGLRLRKPGRHLAEVQRAFFYPETVTRVSTCNFVLLQVLDYTAILAERGVRALRTSQLELGALAQAASLSMTADGGFLRPCRSFDTDRLATLAGLTGGQTVSYLCLGGRSRFTDLLLDLRP
ncbi:MAG: hypothetical protein ABI140_08600 [Jatrophihabitantaceae bacterium]